MPATPTSTDQPTRIFRLTGLTCTDCAARLEKAIGALPGVDRARLNFGAGKLTVEGVVDPKVVIREAAQYDGTVARLEGAPAGPARNWRERLPQLRMVTAGLCILAGWIAEYGFGNVPLGTALFAAAIPIGGYATIRQGLRALARMQFDMNGMMTGAVIGAAFLGEWEEGAVVAFLYSASNWLEGYTMDRARRSIRSLMDLAPKMARVRRDGGETKIPVEAVRLGDLLLIRPGESLPMDGTVRAGISAVNQAPITGEAIPVDKAAGDPVYAGTINGHGALEVEVTRRVDDTTLARIIHLVEEAQAQRAPSQQAVERFARVYTPAVFALAVGLMVVPSLLFGQPWEPWIYRGLALLIVSCPCALVISTPVTIASAIANAARRGVLIKGGAHIEELGRLKVIALDKTGTLTRGKPEVTDLVPWSGQGAAELLALAAGVEAHSEHPLARAIVRAAKRDRLALPVTTGFTAIPGQGGSAALDGQTIYVGSPRLFASLNGCRQDGQTVEAIEAQGKTAILVGTAERLLGLIALEDQLRPASRRAVADLRAAGIRHVALLTGDNRVTAEAIATQVGADTVRAELLPEQKLAAVHALRMEFGSLAMVGDGVNDAPALAAASVGIAMGATGSDVALETADVALMADDLSKLPQIMRLGRQTIRVIRQNIAIALAIKAVAIAAVFPGWLTLWLAVLGDMGASVLVTLNGMRLLRWNGAARHTPGIDRGRHS
ncbi:MAG: heavy metal translocating P-type ATPase [candidate division NC10 bacterium]|nr:heavy metal translocating P-type ATPase [candidate division NC10 bacterium]